MEVKIFEIRDRGTFIPAMAIKLLPRSEEERYLLPRTGYGLTPERQSEYVLLFKLGGGLNTASCDPYGWNNRTMAVAHEFILEHWSQLASGEVIDVEFILGETQEKKTTERIEGGHL